MHLGFSGFFRDVHGLRVEGSEKTLFFPGFRWNLGASSFA